ncbi:MAG: hypothetical protein QG622_3597 [Actinomycetota bacterium]|nr:hypothetical protein [Actinomycetota bacterium]
MTTDAHQPPIRQVRAAFDETTLIVYQAYSPQIADAALAAGTFVPPFKLERMTWIKPSFLWMMYRSGWATKPCQERILAVRITRTGFEKALGDACLSRYVPGIHASHDDWRHLKQVRTVRVQWDPERSPHLDPLPWRTIQVGLSGATAHQYVSQWITDITDITQTAHDLRRLLHQGETAAAQQLLRLEKPYPLPPTTAQAIGVTELT